MFIKDGKTLFGNTGLILAIIILVLLLIFSYNKCYKQPEAFTFSRFADATNPNLPTPMNARIVINGSSLTLNFTVDTMGGKPLPKSFLVILVQYDSNLKNTGNNKFYLSNEMLILHTQLGEYEEDNKCLQNKESKLP